MVTGIFTEAQIIPNEIFISTLYSILNEITQCHGFNVFPVSCVVTMSPHNYLI